MKKILIRTLFMVLLSGLFLSAECQKAQPDVKIKSIVVTEEKSESLIKKQYKELMPTL